MKSEDPEFQKLVESVKARNQEIDAKKDWKKCMEELGIEVY